jgi:hypothetical protein
LEATPRRPFDHPRPRTGPPGFGGKTRFPR